MTWALDLDGVVWLADQPIPGSVEALAELRRRQVRVLFVTNNSSATVGQYVDKLCSMGVEAVAEDVVTSAQAAASLLEPGRSALVCAGPGVEEALAERGVKAVRDGPADYVVVGWHRDFDFQRLTAAMTAVRGGAQLVGTNSDATYPTPDGLVPGAGSLLAAVSYASGVEPVVAGKPHQPIVELIRRRAGDVDLVVGDRIDTDGLLARRLERPFGLVLTGVTHEVPTGADAPAHVAPDLAGLVGGLFADGMGPL